MDDPQYHVVEDAANFLVQDTEGRTLLSYRDQGSAEQSAALMNTVYARGFKAGLRKGRAG